MAFAALIARVVGGLIVGLAMGWWLRHAQTLADPVEVAHSSRRQKREDAHRHADRHRLDDGQPTRAARGGCAPSRCGRPGGCFNAAPEGGLEGRCAVCFAERACLGFVHGSVVHCCLCRGCHAELCRRGADKRCLVCNQRSTGCVQVVGT